MSKTTFALYFANRGFFPGELIDGSRRELCKAVEEAGCSYICMDAGATKYGAVETAAEGAVYAEFLKSNAGAYDGVIVCLPNFGDENGALASLRDAGVPILVQAYPDVIGSMDFSSRRDALAGKFAMCNVLRQAGIPFTLTENFVTSPLSENFRSDLNRFAAVCRVVKGMKRFTVGAIGARTTAFKTVRCDEAALQKKGITVEAIDLSEIFALMDNVSPGVIESKKRDILAVTSAGPEEKLNRIAALQAVLEDIVKRYSLDALAIRCWSEFQTVKGIAPCTNVGILNQSGIAAACEVDITNAVMMRALSLAADAPTMLLDYNNNYGAEADKCIVFHCGPIPISLMKGKGTMIEHLMFKKTFGPGSGMGVNKGEMLSGNVTFGSLKTEDGKISAFVSEGELTDDPIESGFFGSGKVLKKANINDVANFMAQNGYKHHICIGYGRFAGAVNEAFSKYLGYDTNVLD